MKDKTRCKKCGQKLPRKFPEFLHGTVIIPGVRHAEKAVTLEYNGLESYTNTESVDFWADRGFRLGEYCIVRIDGVHYLVGLSYGCQYVNCGDMIIFDKGALSFGVLDLLVE